MSAAAKRKRALARRGKPRRRPNIGAMSAILKMKYPDKRLTEAMYAGFPQYAFACCGGRCCRNEEHPDCLACHELALECGRWTREAAAKAQTVAA